MSEKNNSLELAVAEKFKEFFPDSRPTKNSGGATEQGDVLNPDWHIECKLRNTSDITIKENVWLKTVAECPYNKAPIYFLQNKAHRRLVVLDIDTFFSLLKDIKYFQENEQCQKF